MNKDLLVIDADGHYVENVAAWAARMPANLRDRAPKLIIENGREHFTIGDLYCLPSKGANLMGGMTMGDGMSARKRGNDAPELRGRLVSESDLPGRDPVARLKMMDEEGMAISVLFPTMGLACFTAIPDPTLVHPLATALNDWLIDDFCAADPKRLVPVATLPLHDPAEAARELERCAKKGVKAAWMSPVPVMGRTIDHRDHDIVWAKAAELGITMTTHHGSGGGISKAMGRDRNNTWLGSHAMGHSFEAMAAIVGLYTSRVFQRFPTIKWGFMEAGCGWLPFWLHQIHEHAERMRFLLPDLPEDEEIIDIFHDRCFLTAEADDPLINAALDAGGERCMVWASDFPHFDCSMPGVAQELRDRTDLPPARLKALASTNAIEFFGLQNLVSAAAAAS